MPNKTKSIILIVVMIILAAGGAALTSQIKTPDNVEENSSVHGDTSTISQVDTSNETSSPYDYSDRPYGCFNPVHDTALKCNGVVINTATQQQKTFVHTIDVGDVINIVLPLQPAEIDISRIKVYAFAHENMQDPFLNTIDKFQSPIFVSEFEETEKGVEAQAMIGYNATLTAVVDFVFTYKDKIVYYAVFMTENQMIQNKEYWESRYPDKTFDVFYIVMDGKKEPHYYTPIEGLTLYDWVSQPPASRWTTEYERITNNAKTIMIDKSFNDELIVPGLEIPTIPYKDATFEDKFDINDEQYLLSYIGKTGDNVIATFGTPDSKATKEDVQKLIYADMEFYIHKNTVKQINILTNKYQPVKYLPSEPCELGNLLEFVDILDLEYPSIAQYPTNPETKLNKSEVSIVLGEMSVTYVWETIKEHDVQVDKFTRIVLHPGPSYLY